MSLRPRIAPEFLLLLIATDALFIVLHLLRVYTPWFNDAVFSLEKDRGMSEVFQYVKEYWIALTFILLTVLTRERSYLSWSLVFGYLLVDDSFQLHERGGIMLAHRLGFQSILALRPQDSGELAVSAAVGTGLLLMLLITYFPGSHQFRRISRRLALAMVALVFFGVFIDMVHIAIGRYSGTMNRGLGLLEDAGELLVMSCICWFVYSLLLRERAPQNAADSFHADEGSEGRKG